MSGVATEGGGRSKVGQTGNSRSRRPVRVRRTEWETLPRPAGTEIRLGRRGQYSRKGQEGSTDVRGVSGLSGIGKRTSQVVSRPLIVCGLSTHLLNCFPSHSFPILRVHRSLYSVSGKPVPIGPLEVPRNFPPLSKMSTSSPTPRPSPILVSLSTLSSSTPTGVGHPPPHNSRCTYETWSRPYVSLDVH